MEHITKYTMEKILRSADVNKINIRGSIYKRYIPFFSKNEEKKILIFKEFLKNIDGFIKIYQKKEDTDEARYVYESGISRYHKEHKCEKLLSNFENFIIPPNIKSEEKQKFRDFFKKQRHLFDDKTKQELFVLHLKQLFPNISISEIQAVNYQNSGITIIENLNLIEIEEQIDNFILQEKDYVTHHPKGDFLLRYDQRSAIAFGQNPDINDLPKTMTKVEALDLLRNYHTNFKVPIMKYLKEYFRVLLNPELKFEGYLLEQLGIKPCAHCYAKND